MKANDYINLPDADSHNRQIENAIAFLLDNRPNFAIIDKGVSIDESSCIWVENGHFYGMGYITLDIAITNLAEIKDYVTLYKSNQYIMGLIYKYAESNPRKIFTIQKQN